MTVEQELKSFIFDELMEGQPAEGDPVAEGKLDSLAMEQIIGFIEERYQVTFTDDELVPENFTSLEAVAAFVEAKRTDADRQ